MAPDCYTGVLHMVLRMARLKSRKNSSIPPFRERVPADVLELAKGQRPTIRLQAAVAGEPDVIVTPKLGDAVWFSLQTNDPVLALQRQTSAKLQLARFYDVLRNGPKPLTQIQIVELAGIAYRQMVAEYRDEPGDAEDWDLGRELTVDALEGYHQDGNFRALEHSVGRDVDALLSQHSIVTDKESRERLILKVASSIVHAAITLGRHAGGDYSPDKHIERYAEAKGAITGAEGSAKAKTKATLSDLFESWQRERGPAPSTVITWRGYVRGFREHLGHEDIHKVKKADVIAWKDKLIDAGYSARGIKYGHIAAISALFSYAVDNEILEVNPAKGVKLTLKRTAGTKMLAYTDEEAGRILAMADEEKAPAKRWLPWLLAFSGARVGELAQLWGNRIVEAGGCHVMKIAPAEDGGTLKNEGSEREVPLHPAIIKRGFLDFVRQRGDGPLFYGKRGSGKRHPSKAVANHLAAWIRDQGFADARKAPNHAFRHWFKSACVHAGVQDSVADAIQGHVGNRGEADRYRHVSIAVMAEAIQRIPLPK